jgi:hypothetical protein
MTEHPVTAADWRPAANPGQDDPQIPAPFVMSAADVVQQVDRGDTAARQ